MPFARALQLAGLVVTLALLLTACHASEVPAHESKGAVRGRGCTRIVRPGAGLQRFVDGLRAGAQACLAPGTYRAAKLTVRRSGRRGAPIVLRSEDPGRPATIDGSVWLTNAANFVTVRDVRIVGDSSTLPAVIVNGDHSVWSRDDVSNPPSGGRSGGICFSLGQLGRWGYAGDTTIEHSVVHDCGRSTNMNQGIYVEATTGRTVIRDNWIYRNGDRGVQLYPAARNVLVSHNVIDGNGSGVIFSGDGKYASSGVVVTGNIISNSKVRWNVESSYPGSVVGSGNVVAGNCLWASGAEPFYDRSGGVAPEEGFTVAGNNIVQRPRFAGSGDLRLSSGSGCRGYGPRGPAPPGLAAASLGR